MDVVDGGCVVTYCLTYRRDNVKSDTRERRPMNLGKLIQALSDFRPDESIRFDFGVPLGKLGSWRGSYDELTIYHGTDVHRTVGHVLDDAKAADGKTFQGYKGGDYTMGLHTPVWADDHGYYNSLAIVGVGRNGKGSVTVFTEDMSDYR